MALPGKQREITVIPEPISVPEREIKVEPIPDLPAPEPSPEKVPEREPEKVPA